MSVQISAVVGGIVRVTPNGPKWRQPVFFCCNRPIE